MDLKKSLKSTILVEREREREREIELSATFSSVTRSIMFVILCTQLFTIKKKSHVPILSLSGLLE